MQLVCQRIQNHFAEHALSDNGTDTSDYARILADCQTNFRKASQNKNFNMSMYFV